MQTNPLLKDKVTGAVMGGAIGDSLGLAVETYSRDEILQNFGGEVRDYLPIRMNKFYARALDKHTEEELGFNEGTTGLISDDTILTLANMKSIAQKSGLDIADIFQEHLKHIDKFGYRGFGKGTLAALDNIREGKTSLEDAGSESWGNGVMMKQFPYAAYFLHNANDDNEIDDTIEKIAHVTHRSTIAKLTAMVHNKALIHLLGIDAGKYNPKRLLHYLYNLAAVLEEKYDFTEETDGNMRITPIIKKLMEQQEAIEGGMPYTPEQILETFIVKLQSEGGRPGFHVASTFGLVYSVFLQHTDREGLIKAANIGEDTDSQASIIGNMIGALRGPFYDEKYVDGLRDKQYIEDTSCEFIDLLEPKK